MRTGGGMIIVKPNNCGNAPKNKFIEDFISAVLSNEVYENQIDKDIVVLTYGCGGADSIDKFVTFINDLKGKKIEILDAISHGKKGSIDFEISLHDGSVLSAGIFLEFKTHKADKISYLKIIVSK
jgi:hypothetical protein